MTVTSSPAPVSPQSPAGGRVRAFIEGAGFPLFVLTLLLSASAGIAGLLAVPSGDSALSSFAAEFRQWCLGGGAADGLDVAWVAATFGVPVIVGAATALIWWAPLRALRLRPAGAWLAPVLAGVVVAALAGLGLVPAAAPRAEAGMAFPAASLRTRLAPPPLDLTDHEGHAVSLADLRGRVVLLTSIYSRCSTACPMILAQAHRAIEGLSPEERDGFAAIAVTLDPAHDTAERLAEIAAGRGMTTPTWRLATGEPAVVETVLDRMGVARERDPETGIIDHASLFLLIDREGRLAYRFTVGDLQERWMSEALHLLLREPVPAEPAGPPA